MKLRLALTFAVVASLFGWRQAVSAELAGEVEALGCAPCNPNAAAAMVRGAIWITSDKGTTWKRVAVLPLAGGELEQGWGDSSGRNAIEDDSASIMPSAVDMDTDINQRREARRADEFLSGSEPLLDEETGRDSSLPHLSVGDDGVWAAYAGGVLWAGGPGPGIRARAETKGVKGVAIDCSGRIWVVAGNELRLVAAEAGVSVKSRFPVVGGGSPALEKGGSKLLVPGLEGLSIADDGINDGGIDMRLVRVGRVDAAADAPDSEQSWYLVSNGRLSRFSSGNEAVDLGPAPLRAIQLLVDSEARLMLRTRDKGWFESKGSGWRQMKASAVAVDSEGGRWLGTSSEVVPPLRGARALTALGSGSGRRFAAALYGAMRLLDSFPGPPPIRKFGFNPLPTARFKAGVGRGSSALFELPDASTEQRIETWFYIGVQLTWTFDPILPSERAIQIEKWQTLREKRASEIESLWNSWRRASLLGAAELIAEEIDMEMEKKRLAELIRLKSGVTPAEQEEKR